VLAQGGAGGDLVGVVLRLELEEFFAEGVEGDSKGASRWGALRQGGLEECIVCGGVGEGRGQR